MKLFLSLLILVVSHLSVIPAQAMSAAMDCLDEVEPGQVFLLTIYRKGGADTVAVDFMDKRFFPTIMEVEGGALIRVILGVGLEPMTEILPLKVEVGKGDDINFLEKTITVKKKEFPEERLSVADHFVEPTKEQMKQIELESSLIKSTLSIMTPNPIWKCPFIKPVPGEVTSSYGLRRFFNGEKRAAHRGVDLRAAVGQEVKALAGGRVQLVGDFYFAGNCIYLDHGQGVMSVYAHLSEIKVQRNQEIKAGDVIGLAGATGRVTAPHLHLGLSVLGQMVDPMSFLDLCKKDQ